MLSIAIPSRNEIFLKNTIEDVLKNATGEVEVFPILDGYDIPEDEVVKDPRVTYIRLDKEHHTQKRHGINEMVRKAKGKYVMSLDAHCMMAPGFDEQLAKDHKPNWVQVPRRHRLDAENWCLQNQGDNRPPIDYEYFMWQGLYTERKGLHGFKWDARSKDRADIMLDENMTMQASCWFMEKAWYEKMGFMNIERYSGWGQEAEEIGLTTWMNGGKLITNKNTWYAHLHKGKKYGRMYFMSKKSQRKCYADSYDWWCEKNKEFFIKHVERFWPVPKWPDNWKELLWKR